MTDKHENQSQSNMSGTARQIVSLLICLHFLALFIGIVSGMRSASDLMVRFRQVPGAVAYLQFLNLDRPTDREYHLTYNQDTDAQHRCDVFVNWQDSDPSRDNSDVSFDGETELLTLFPEGPFVPGQRRIRYQRLARAVAARNDSETTRAILPRAIARRLLWENNIDQGRHLIGCWRWDMPLMMDLNSSASPRNNLHDIRRLESVYLGYVDYSRATGRFRISERETSQQTAKPRGD